MRPPPRPSAPSGRDLLLLLPLAGALVFVAVFARALPLTDEWFYTRALRRLHDVDWTSLAGWAQAWRVYPAKLFDHHVPVPFVLYGPLMEATGYDSRWAIGLTVAAFAGQVWIYRAAMLRSAWAALPVAVVVFSPSHYMELLWGWQFTITMSVLFPLAGLAAVDAACVEVDPARRARRLAWALLLLLLGVYSSAGAFFGLVSALLVVALARLDRPAKARILLVLAVVTALVYRLAMRGGTRPRVVFGGREALEVLTAFGATFWSLPVAVMDFHLDLRSVGGLAVVVLTAAAAARALYLRKLAELALPLGVALMGYLCVASIAVARPYLGNWHLQYALAAVCGGYAAAHALWRVDRSPWSAVPLAGLAALLVSSVYGTYVAFAHEGPGYRHYVRSIEDYQLRNLTEPGLKPPYPPQHDNDMGAELFLFLAAHGHPLFATLPAPRAAGPLPSGARVFWDGTEVGQHPTLEGGRGKASTLTVVVPGDARAAAVLAHVASDTVRLWRVHPLHTPEAARLPDSTSFMAVILPRRLAPGPQRVDLELSE